MRTLRDPLHAVLLGLLLLVDGWRRLVWTITAFTVGHSVTLALAALRFLRYPVDLVEFAIAFSIFVVAVELTRVHRSIVVSYIQIVRWFRTEPPQILN